MGARVVFTLVQEDGNRINLYSHWGETERFADLAHALHAARPRWNDESYAARIIVSNLIGPNWDQETGYGLWASSEDGLYGGDCQDIVINLSNKTVTDETGTHSFDEFVDFHGLNATVAGQGHPCPHNEMGQVCGGLALSQLF